MSCKSCGTEWGQHPGVEPTCKELQEARESLEAMKLRLERFEKENYRLGCLVSELRADADLYRAAFGKEKE
jgi:hypothetical protein